jgi:hypothetical protein
MVRHLTIFLIPKVVCKKANFVDFRIYLQRVLDIRRLGIKYPDYNRLVQPSITLVKPLQGSIGINKSE